MAEGKRIDEFPEKITEPEIPALLLISDPATADSGVAESGTTTSLTDTDKAWTVGQFVAANPYFVYITAGTGSGQIAEITSNSADTLSASFSTAPDATSQYQVIQYTSKKIRWSFFGGASAAGDNGDVQRSDGAGNFVAGSALNFLSNFLSINGKTKITDLGSSGINKTFEVENGSNQKGLTVKDDGKVIHGDYVVELTGDRLKNHFIGNNGRTGLTTFNFVQNVFENNSSCVVSILSKTGDSSFLRFDDQANVAGTNRGFIERDPAAQRWNFFSSNNYFMSMQSSGSHRVVIGRGANDITSADNANLGVIVSADLQMYAPETTAGNTLQNSKCVLFRHAYWTGAPAHKNFIIEAVADDVTGNGHLRIADDAGTNIMEIHQDGSIKMYLGTSVPAAANTLYKDVSGFVKIT